MQESMDAGWLCNLSRTHKFQSVYKCIQIAVSYTLHLHHLDSFNLHAFTIFSIRAKECLVHAQQPVMVVVVGWVQKNRGRRSPDLVHGAVQVYLNSTGELPLLVV